jgi:hypothetical protein
MKQMTLAAAADGCAGFERFRTPTRRDAFLAEMQTIVPWDRLALIKPHYPKLGHGRPAIGLQRMLRIHLLQPGFNLADEAMEEAPYDSASLRAFAGIDLGREPVDQERRAAARLRAALALVNLYMAARRALALVRPAVRPVAGQAARNRASRGHLGAQSHFTTALRHPQRRRATT